MNINNYNKSKLIFGLSIFNLIISLHPGIFAVNSYDSFLNSFRQKEGGQVAHNRFAHSCCDT